MDILKLTISQFMDVWIYAFYFLGGIVITLFIILFPHFLVDTTRWRTGKWYYVLKTLAAIWTISALLFIMILFNNLLKVPNV